MLPTVDHGTPKGNHPSDNSRSKTFGGPPKPENREEPDQAEPPGEEPQSWEEDLHIGTEDRNLRPEVLHMLSEFKDMRFGELGMIKEMKHQIDLMPYASPISHEPLCTRPTALENEKTEIDRMLRSGVIKPVNDEWAGLMVLVPKKDGTMRLCVE